KAPMQGPVEQVMPSIQADLTPATTGDEASGASLVEDASGSGERGPTPAASAGEISSVRQIEEVRARIEIDAANRGAQVNKLLFGNSVIAAGRGNGILDLNHQLNPEALRMIRELKPSILRFGGQPIFEDGIGDARTRPA
ncbi:unnamed protein product, partial [marine sediment metagenome]